LRLVPKNKDRPLGLGDFAELLEDTHRTLYEAQSILHTGHLFIGIAGLGTGSVRVTVGVEPASDKVPQEDAERVVGLFVQSIIGAEQLQNGVPAEVRALWGTRAFRELANNAHKTLQSYRSVTGKLEAVNIHKLREFRVYSPEGTVTRCRFPEQMFDQVRRLLGKRVIVRGTQAGETLKVESLERREEKRGLLLDMKGAWKGLLDEPSEVVIRRMRNEDEKEEEQNGEQE